jgi:hypothetical protein
MKERMKEGRKENLSSDFNCSCLQESAGWVREYARIGLGEEEGCVCQTASAACATPVWVSAIRPAPLLLPLLLPLLPPLPLLRSLISGSVHENRPRERRRERRTRTRTKRMTAEKQAERYDCQKSFRDENREQAEKARKGKERETKKKRKKKNVRDKDQVESSFLDAMKSAADDAQQEQQKMKMKMKH